MNPHSEHLLQLQHYTQSISLQNLICFSLWLYTVMDSMLFYRQIVTVKRHFACSGEMNLTTLVNKTLNFYHYGYNPCFQQFHFENDLNLMLWNVVHKMKTNMWTASFSEILHYSGGIVLDLTVIFRGSS